MGAISALTGTAGSNYGAQATTQGAALGQLGGTLGTGLGLNQQLQGLGGLLQTQGSTGSTALTGGVTNSTSALLGRGSSYGVDSTASAQSSYGLQNLSSFGITAGSTTNRLSDGVSRGYTPSSGSNNTSSSGTRVFVRNVSMCNSGGWFGIDVLLFLDSFVMVLLSPTSWRAFLLNQKRYLLSWLKTFVANV